MGIKLIGSDLDHRNGDVGAVVGDTLVVGQQIIQHKAVLDGADTGLQAGNVAGLDLAHETVHDLLKRFDLAGGVDITFLERIDRAVDDILHGGFEHAEVAEGFLAELDGLVADLLGRFNKVDGVVGNALEIADGVQQGVDRAVILSRKVLGAEFDEVGAQHVLVMVDGIFLASDLIGDGVVPLMGSGHSLQQCGAADLGHIAAGEHGAGHGHGRGGEQTFVKQGVFLLLVGGGVGHGQDGQLFQRAVERQQNGRCNDVENRMNDGDTEGIGRGVKEAEADQCMQAVEPAQEDDGADDVEIEMNERRTLGVFVCTG